MLQELQIPCAYILSRTIFWGVGVVLSGRWVGGRLQSWLSLTVKQLQTLNYQNPILPTYLFIINFCKLSKFKINWIVFARTSSLALNKLFLDALRPRPIWQSSEFFSSNYFQIGQHVVLLHIQTTAVTGSRRMVEGVAA